MSGYDLPDPMAGSGIETRGPYNWWYAKAPKPSSGGGTPPPQVPVTTPPPPAALAPLDPQQLAAVLYDKDIPLGFSTRSQWGGRIIEGPVFGTVNNERVVSFIAGYYIPINFWDATRTITELFFRGQLAWRQSTGALLSGLNVGVATVGGAQTVRFATGTLAQTPDAWSVARYGAQAVAYVPLVTATFENIRIAQFGNIVPFTSVTVADTAPGTPGDLTAWADAIEALARHDGRGPEEFETVDVSGGINALILGSKINFIEFLSGMRKHKPQWNIRTAEKLRLIEKGSFSLDLTLELAKMVNHGAQPITVHTSDAFDTPREKICHYIDVDRDYEPSNVRVAEDIDPVIVTDALQSDSYDIPVASTADIVMTETSFAYYTEEIARTKSEFSGMAHYLALEPGDCYKWTSAAGRQYFHRVNEIVRRADFTIDVKGEGFLTCAIAEVAPVPVCTCPATSGTGTSFNPADKSAGIVLTFGNRAVNAAGPVAHDEGVRVVNAVAPGKKCYYEYVLQRRSVAGQGCGFANITASLPGLAAGAVGGVIVTSLGAVYFNGAATGISLVMTGDCDTIRLALDLVNFRFWARVNTGYWNGSSSADPASNLGGLSVSDVFSAGVSAYAAASTLDSSSTFVGWGNFGGTPFNYSKPAGFLSYDAAVGF